MTETTQSDTAQSSTTQSDTIYIAQSSTTHVLDIDTNQLPSYKAKIKHLQTIGWQNDGDLLFDALEIDLIKTLEYLDLLSVEHFSDFTQMIWNNRAIYERYIKIRTFLWSSNGSINMCTIGNLLRRQGWDVICDIGHIINDRTEHDISNTFDNDMWSLALIYDYGWIYVFSEPILPEPWHMGELGPTCTLLIRKDRTDVETRSTRLLSISEGFVFVVPDPDTNDLIRVMTKLMWLEGDGYIFVEQCKYCIPDALFYIED